MSVFNFVNRMLRVFFIATGQGFLLIDWLCFYS